MSQFTTTELSAIVQKAAKAAGYKSKDGETEDTLTVNVGKLTSRSDREWDVSFVFHFEGRNMKADLSFKEHGQEAEYTCSKCSGTALRDFIAYRCRRLHIRSADRKQMIGFLDSIVPPAAE